MPKYVEPEPINQNWKAKGRLIRRLASFSFPVHLNWSPRLQPVKCQRAIIWFRENPIQSIPSPTLFPVPLLLLPKGIIKPCVYVGCLVMPVFRHISIPPNLLPPQESTAWMVVRPRQRRFPIKMHFQFLDSVQSSDKSYINRGRWVCLLLLTKWFSIIIIYRENYQQSI